MTLSNSVRVLLPTAFLSDRISDHGLYCAQSCRVLESKALFQLLRRDKRPGYVALRSKALVRGVYYFPIGLSFGAERVPCCHT
jgi:hypothetical protein